MDKSETFGTMKEQLNTGFNHSSKDYHRQRLLWIDLVKAICMISVYLYHCEGYYHFTGNYLGYWVKPFYVNAFFFVSGYLFFGKWLPNKMLINLNSGERGGG